MLLLFLNISNKTLFVAAFVFFHVINATNYCHCSALLEGKILFDLGSVPSQDANAQTSFCHNLSEDFHRQSCTPFYAIR